MSQHAWDALEARYPVLIEQMRSEFTSHEFIIKLAQQNQQLYIEALHTYRGNGRPFATVHGQLSKRLRNFPHLVLYDGEVNNSRDIFGQSEPCAKWRKV